jgi:hypothetical protein
LKLIIERTVPVASANELRTTAAKMCSECFNDVLENVRNKEIDRETGQLKIYASPEIRRFENLGRRKALL